MDIVIPLSQWTGTNHAELRYALRSFVKFLPHDNVVIIGHKPKWIKEITYIPYRDDPQPDFRESNIFLKIRYFVERNPEVENFVFANDDHFLLKSFQAHPYLIKGSLKECYDQRDPKDPYRKTIDNTIKLIGTGLVGNYDIHTPMVFSSKEFIKIFLKPEREATVNRPEEPNRIKWTTRYGYLFKTLYGHFSLSTAPKRIHADFKINQPLRDVVPGEIPAIFQDIPFFSTSDMAFDERMEGILKLMFPEKSKYEL